MLHEWVDMVELYRTCGLTFETDRLKAIAGLARVFQPKLKCRYLAGVWEYQFLPQLMWSCVSTDEPRVRSKTYHAPTWSWESVPGTIALRNDLFNLVEDVSQLVTIDEVEVKTTNDQEMGELTSVFLRVSGPLWSMNTWNVGSLGDPRIWVIKIEGAYVYYYPDYRGDGGNSLGSLSVLYFLYCFSSEGNSDWFGQGLMLRPTPTRQGEFVRVGFASYGRLDSSANVHWVPQLVSREEVSEEARVEEELRKREERRRITESVCESYDEDTDTYTITIV
jgi:hypothetical protein